MMVAMDVAIAILMDRSARQAAVGKYQGQEGADQHAAANTQKPGQIASGQTPGGQFNNQQGFEGHKVKVSAVGHRTRILNRGSGGRGQHQLWVHLTRDDHAHQAMFQARAL